jgi:hypothetical protein
MFGHQDDNHDKLEDAPAPPDAPSPDTPENQDQAAINDDTPAVALSTDDNQDWQHPGTPLNDKPADDHENQDRIRDVVSPAGGFPRSTNTQVGSHPGTPSSPPLPDLVDTDPIVNDLIDIRQHALTELAPLLDQLDLNPEDRFRTLMLVIQASDDQKLIKEAYEAAHGITDDKVRAQALLDLINEINYFTTQHPAED